MIKSKKLDYVYTKNNRRYYNFECLSCGSIVIKRSDAYKSSCGCDHVKAVISSNQGRKLPTDKDRILRHAYRNYVSSANTRGLLWEISFELFSSQVLNPCVYCGNMDIRKLCGMLTKCNGLDRVDNTKGYFVDNIVPCCGKCNMMKGTMSTQEFIDHIKTIYNETVKW